MAAGSNCGADKPRALRRAAIYSTTPLTAYNAALKKKVDNTQSVQVEEIQRLGQRLKYSLGSVSFAQAEPQNVRSSDGHWHTKEKVLKICWVPVVSPGLVYCNSHSEFVFPSVNLSSKFYIRFCGRFFYYVAVECKWSNAIARIVSQAACCQSLRRFSCAHMIQFQYHSSRKIVKDYSNSVNPFLVNLALDKQNRQF